jgi:hypothetical protein
MPVSGPRTKMGTFQAQAQVMARQATLSCCQAAFEDYGRILHISSPVWGTLSDGASRSCPLSGVHIVTYRPISKQQLCKQATVQQPLRGNSYVHTLFPWQRENTQQKRCFLYVPCRGYITRTNCHYKAVPCGGGVKYLRRSPARRRRRQKAKSRIWGSKIWSRVPRDLNSRMNALARASSNCKWHAHPLAREDVI